MTLPPPPRCRLPVARLGRGAPHAGAARTRGCTLASGATRVHIARRRATSSSDELFRPSSQRDLTVGAAGRAAEGGQVAAKGRAGRRGLPYCGSWRSVHNRSPAAWRRSQRPTGGGEGAAEAWCERQPANRAWCHRAHGCCWSWPPLHSARSPAVLGRPRPAGQRRRHRPDGGRRRRSRGVREGPAASQGQHRAARRQRLHRPAVRRG